MPESKAIAPCAGDLVFIVHASDPEIYDVTRHIGRAGRVSILAPWCGEHMAKVTFARGDVDYFHPEELAIRNRRGRCLDSTKPPPEYT